MTTVEIDLISRFAVRRDGHEVPTGEFGGRLARRLVRLLALQRGRLVTRDTLIDALWGDSPPADPAVNLNVLVNRARRALGGGDVIGTLDGGYVLREGRDIAVDAETFLDRAHHARAVLDTGDVAGAGAAAEEALALWPGGDPLPEDAYEDWAAPHRERLERAYREALEVGAAAALGNGTAHRAAQLAREAIAIEPLREAAHLLLVRALAEEGDQAAALAAYDHLRRTLADELGIDPSRRADELHQRLLRGEPVGAIHAPTHHRRLVGRDHELATLSRVLREGGVALVAGRAGSGKSRLLAEMAAGAGAPAVLQARAVLPERESPWSLAQALLQAAVDQGVDIPALLPARTTAALAEVMPDLDSSGATSLEARTLRALVLNGGVQVLQAASAPVVVVDDLQWADASSLDLLALHAARLQQGALVLAYRPEDVPEGSAAARFVTDLRAASHPAEVALGRLARAAIAELAGSPEVGEVLAEHTDGTPFAVLEAMRRAEEEGLPDAGPAERARSAALAGKQRALWGRVERQQPREREILSVLALLGRPATVALLGDAVRMTVEEVLDSVGTLTRAELVRHDAGGFAPAHDLVSETVRERLDAVERIRLHARLAQALQQVEAPADELARHRAGSGDHRAAAEAYVTASRDRLDHFADPEAERLAEEGLALDPPAASRAALLEVRAETRARRGDYAQARADLGEALAATTDAPSRSRHLARLAGLAMGAEDLVHARDLARLALTEAGDDAPARARALYQAALVDMNLDGHGEADSLYAQALELFERLNDGAGVADILDGRAIATFLAGDISGGVQQFIRAASLFADSGNLLRVVTPRSVAAHGLGFMCRFDEALEAHESAVQLARSLGYTEGEAFASWQHADTLRAAGHVEAALALAGDALAIARRIDHRSITAGSLCALTLAQRAAGDAEAAEASCRQALTASHNLPMFACWVHARLAMLLIDRAALDEAAEHVEQALAIDMGLTAYEARLASCELAVARGDDNAHALIAEARHLAVQGGHLLSAGRLGELSS